MTCELRDDAAADVLDVDRAIAEVFERRLRQVVSNLVDRALDRPFGVDQSLAIAAVAMSTISSSRCIIRCASRIKR